MTIKKCILPFLLGLIVGPLVMVCVSFLFEPKFEIDDIWAAAYVSAPINGRYCVLVQNWGAERFFSVKQISTFQGEGTHVGTWDLRKAIRGQITLLHNGAQFGIRDSESNIWLLESDDKLRKVSSDLFVNATVVELCPSPIRINRIED